MEHFRSKVMVFRKISILAPRESQIKKDTFLHNFHASMYEQSMLSIHSVVYSIQCNVYLLKTPPQAWTLEAANKKQMKYDILCISLFIVIWKL